jgi:hypothetical protein
MKESVDWPWAKTKAWAQRLDGGLDAALREYGADLGTGFSHESDRGDVLVLVALEDWKYKLRHDGSRAEQSFRPRFSDRWTEIWDACTDYSDPRPGEKIVRDFIELAKRPYLWTRGFEHRLGSSRHGLTRESPSMTALMTNCWLFTRSRGKWTGPGFRGVHDFRGRRLLRKTSLELNRGDRVTMRIVDAPKGKKAVDVRLVGDLSKI